MALNLEVEQMKHSDRFRAGRRTLNSCVLETGWEGEREFVKALRATAGIV